MLKSNTFGLEINQALDNCANLSAYNKKYGEICKEINQVYKSVKEMKDNKMNVSGQFTVVNKIKLK